MEQPKKKGRPPKPVLVNENTAILTRKPIKELNEKTKKDLRAYFNNKYFTNFKDISEIKKYSKRNKLYQTENIYNDLAVDYNNRLKQIKKSDMNEKKQIQNNIIQNLKDLKKKNVNEVVINMNELRQTHTLAELVRLITKTIPSNNKSVKYTFEIGNKIYTMNDNVRRRLLNIIESDVIRKIGVNFSDTELITEIKNIDEIVIKKYTKTENTYNTNAGAFFKYINNTIYDLTRYAIFNEFNVKNYKDNCFIYALKQYGYKDNELVELKQMLKNYRNLPVNQLERVCDVLQIQIKLRTHIKSNIRTFGKNYNKIVEMCLLDDHYFIYDEKSNNTSFSIENYELVKDKTDANYIYKLRDDGVRRDKTRTINSMLLITKLLEQKETLLTEININNSSIAMTQYYDNVEFDDEDLITSQVKTITEEDKLNYKTLDEFKYADIEKRNELLYENKENKKLINMMLQEKKQAVQNELLKYAPLIIFDFETITNFGNDEHGNKINNPHIPYLCSICYEDNNTLITKTFIGFDCGLQMLKYIQKNINNHFELEWVDKNKSEEIINNKTPYVMVAHNTKYDFSFIFDYLIDLKYCKNGNRFITANGYFNNEKFVFRDNLNLIAKPLKDLPKMFKLDCKKEIMPYDLYTIENVEKQVIELDKALELLYKDKDEFVNNLKSLKLLHDNKFNIIEYSKFYCEQDVYILYKSYTIFRKWIKYEFNIDIKQKNTITSICKEYFINNDGFKDCKTIRGCELEFIKKSVVGGRVMVRNNEKIIVDDKVSDFDAVSLYPTAIKRLCNEYGGFLKGNPKLLQSEDLNMNFLNNVDGYFVKINIKSIGTERSIPTISYLDDEGNRLWTNDVVGKDIIVNKIQLEDFIIFHHITFEIKSGYYYNEGRTNKIGELIENVFNMRLKYKKEKNPIQEVYKLILNACYGFTIQKAPEVEIKIFDDEQKANNYLFKNYDWIECGEKIGSKMIFEKIKKVGLYENYSHIGSEILAMSKRIVNEVIYTAEDNGIDVYYTDTDSLHLKKDDLNKLVELYESKYNKTLVGKMLGQFHTDFELEGATNEVYAYKSIYLGKKMYLDLLTDGNIKGEHIRLKGIPNKSIKDYCIKNDISVEELYENIYDGDCVEFDVLQGFKIGYNECVTREMGVKSIKVC
jgi:hypothetical protein